MEDEEITKWRIKYKKQHGGFDIYNNLYKDHNKKEYEDVPIYESPLEYPLLKAWSDNIALAICNIVTKEDFKLKNQPYIITNREGELNAGSGWISELDETCFIELDMLFLPFIKHIGIIGERLFDVQHESELNDIKKLMDINIGRDPDIYKYFRNIFYEYMFRCTILDDENILGFALEKIIYDSIGSLPPLNLKVDFLNCGIIMEAMGLFIMGHEYSHIILHSKPDSYPYSSKIVKSYHNEYEADLNGFLLMDYCMAKINNIGISKAKYSFIGVEILLNCLLVLDRMKNTLEGYSNVNINKTHPITENRIEKMREFLNISGWRKYESEYRIFAHLDAVDYIFKKLGDDLVKEMSENKHILAYCQSKKIKIENYRKQIDDTFKLLVEKANETGVIDKEIEKKIIEISINILNEDKNDIGALFILSGYYLENDQYDEAIDIYMQIAFKIYLDSGENTPKDARCFIAEYYLGVSLIKKAEAILKKADWKPNNKQQKEIDILYNEAILFLTDTNVIYYTPDEKIFYYIGIAYKYKNCFIQAIHYLNKALKYFPSDKIIIASQKDSLSTAQKNLAKFSANIEHFTEHFTGITEISADKANDIQIIGFVYEYGLGVPANLEKAFHWYTKAAEMGCAFAQYDLGVFYENGYVESKNLTKAIYWYTKAAEQGYPLAQEELKRLNNQKPN
jgi:TPR repeat protein